MISALRIIIFACVFAILSTVESPAKLWSQDNVQRSSARTAQDNPIRASEVIDVELNAAVVVWTTEIGYSTGPITVHDDVAFLGTSISDVNQDAKAMLCVSCQTGDVLDQIKHQPLPNRANDMPGQAIKSRVCIDGDRAFYVSNRGELVSLDIAALNDLGPIYEGIHIDWSLDMVSELGVFKRDAGDIGNPTSSPVAFGDLVFCTTGHGTTFGYRNSFPASFPPTAPTFIAVNKETGKIVWSSDASSGTAMLGQWATPVVIGNPESAQVIFPGGDGVLYGLNAKDGQQQWSLDCNSPDRTAWTPYKMGTRCFFQCQPSISGNILFGALTKGREASGSGIGAIVAVDLINSSQDNVPHLRWTYENRIFGQPSGAPQVLDDRVYSLSDSGQLLVLDASNGDLVSMQSIGGSASLLGSVTIDQARLFVCSENEMSVFAIADKPKCLVRYRFPKTIENSPTISGDLALVTTRGRLWAIRLNGEE